MGSKAYAAYGISDTDKYTNEELTSLVAANQKSAVDNQYKSLAASLEADYKKSSQSINDEYYDKRNALAVTQAKNKKDLSNYIDRNGYTGSGIEYDSRLKSALSYQSDLAGLGKNEATAKAELENVKNEKNAELEREKISEKSKIDESSYEKLRQLEKDKNEADVQARELALKEAQLELERKTTEAEIANKTAETQALKAQSDSLGSSEKTNNIISAYKTEFYNRYLLDYDGLTTLYERESFYDSITGQNAQKVQELIGEENYKKLLKTINADLGSQRQKENHRKNVAEIFSIFKENKTTGYTKKYIQLKNDITFGKFPKYSLDELDEAFVLYKQRYVLK